MSLTEEVREEQKWAAAGEKLVAANLVEKVCPAVWRMPSFLSTLLAQRSVPQKHNG